MMQHQGTLEQEMPRPVLEEKAEQYTYKGLEHNGNIRLLRLLKGSQNDPVTSLLYEVKLEDRHKYQALSYCWGGRKLEGIIKVGNFLLPTTQSLVSALRRLWYPDAERLLWVDAVCINQEDENEKSLQVGMMGKIFSSAEKVLIYLGEAAENSEDVPKLLKTILLALRQIQPSKSPKANWMVPEKRIPYIEYAELDLPPYDDRRWHSIQRLLDRPWFSRVWTLQEAVVAQKALVVCGNWEIPFGAFSYGISLAEALGLPVSNLSSIKPGAVGLPLMVILLLQNACSRRQHIRLIDLLQHCRSIDATEPRDHLFAPLGILKDPIPVVLRPDYTEEIRDVCVRFARYLILQGEGEELMLNAGLLQAGVMPSWVANWSSRFDYPFVIGAKHEDSIFGRKWWKTYQAGGTGQVRIAVTENMDILVVEDVMIVDDLRIVDEGLPHGLRRNQHLDSEEVGRLVSWTANQIDKLLAGLDGAYPTGQSFEEVKWRTMTCDLHKNITDSLCPNDPATHFRAFEFLRTIGSEHDSSNHGNNMSETENLGKSFTPLFSDMLKQIETVLEQSSEIDLSTQRSFYKMILPVLSSVDPDPMRKLAAFLEASNMFKIPPAVLSDRLTHIAQYFVDASADFCRYKHRGLTQKGFLCQVELGAKPGDVVAIVQGCRLPLALRNIEIGVYKLVGGCYVHGLMQGQALSGADHFRQTICIS